jgi:hypothetical protein
MIRKRLSQTLETGDIVVQDVESAFAPREAFFDAITSDKQTLNKIAEVLNGMSATSSQLREYIRHWDKYKPLWDIDMDSFFRRYSKSDHSLEEFKVDIMRHRATQRQIEDEAPSTAISFIKVDNSLVKGALLDLTLSWQRQLTTLLSAMAKKELDAITKHLSHVTKKLSHKPATLDELAQQTRFVEESHAGEVEFESRFAPLEEIYATLESFQVQLPEDEMNLVASVRELWADFLVMLVSAQDQLDDSMESMRQNLDDALASLGLLQQPPLRPGDVLVVAATALQGLRHPVDLSNGAPARLIIARLQQRCTVLRVPPAPRSRCRPRSCSGSSSGSARTSSTRIGECLRSRRTSAAAATLHSFDEETQALVPATRNAFDVEIGLLAAVFVLLSAVAHGLVLIFWDKYLADLERQTNRGAYI